MSNEDAPAAQPPRFVPTLTEVVKTDAAPEPAQVPPAAAEAAANPAPAVPPAVGAAEHAMATADELLARLGPDLDRLISEATGLHVQVAEDPLTCVARGGGRALELLDLHGNEFFAAE